MRAYFFILIALAVLARRAEAAYKPGTPGAPWTENQAELIQEKLFEIWRGEMHYDRFWKNPKVYSQEFDNGRPNAKFTDWLYDPTKRLSTVDCDLKKHLCKVYWGEMRNNSLAFTPPKAIRLAFHDCMPYEDGTGTGCDGCLDFDGNEEDHNVLQPTVAILEKIYREKDYPVKSSLVAAPVDLGFSRADLWSFASLVALDFLQNTTKSMCRKDLKGLTCHDWPAEECYQPFPGSARKLFKTGRVDCKSKSTNHRFQYLAPKKEAVPDKNGNGNKTVAYFKNNFGLNGREGLSLMGAHTVGGYSTFATHTDYAWTREKGSRRNRVFNNEYYKKLAADKYPSRVKDTYCVGTMEDTKPEHKWYVNNLQFENYWPQHKFTSPDCRPNCKWNKTAILDLTGKPAPRQPWIYKDRRLQWNQFVYRGPVCNAKSWDRSEEDQYGGGDTFWNDDSNKSKPKNKGADAYAKKKGFNGTFFQYCCEEKKRCLKEGNCDQKCNRAVQNRLRYLSSDIGFYLKWKEDKDGYPTIPRMFDKDGNPTDSCRAFEDLGGKSADWKWLEFKTRKSIDIKLAV